MWGDAQGGGFLMPAVPDEGSLQLGDGYPINREIEFGVLGDKLLILRYRLPVVSQLAVMISKGAEINGQVVECACEGGLMCRVVACQVFPEGDGFAGGRVRLRGFR
jgi:hypothetical protein